MFVNEAFTNVHFRTTYREQFMNLLEISGKFSSKLNVFSQMIFRYLLNILESFITKLYDFEKHVAR